MANVNDQRDYCLWDGNKSPVSRPNVPLREASNFNHKNQGFLVSHPTSGQDLRNLDLEEEMEDASHPRRVLGGRGSRAQFIWSNFFNLCKKRSTTHPTSTCRGVQKITKWDSKSTTEKNTRSDLVDLRPSCVIYSISSIRNATNNFSRENLIGRGGYAEVYKGRLRDGHLIAVKRFNHGTVDEMSSNFLSELGVIAHLDHPNIAKLIGYSVEGEMNLVFQLSPLGSLGSLLHGQNKDILDWRIRYEIALGIADGLLYLHENCHKRIIHRDIKTNNILLTEKFQPQICDFGLAKWLPEHCTHKNVPKFEGTFGYFAPEYLMHGIVNEKTDVYSFGVLLLEIITGRKALDYLQQSIVSWAKPWLDSNNLKELVDPSIVDDYNREQMDHVVLTAALCVEQSPILRPRMSQIAILLRGDYHVLELAKEGPTWSHRGTYSDELKDAIEYDLSDLNRHHQVVYDS